MTYRVVQSAACLGLSAYPVRVEVDITYGLPKYTLVGLPDASVRESWSRVRSAIKNCGFRFPSDVVTVNLAPTDIKKEGPSFDLPIAVGLLAASDIIPESAFEDFLLLGELALDGSLRPIKGAIIISTGLKSKHRLILPAQNARQAAMNKEAVIYPVTHLDEVIRFLTHEQHIEPLSYQDVEERGTSAEDAESPDFAEVKGQHFAKRAIEIAVAGGHNLLMIGPPGSGKTMLASRIPSVLPPLQTTEALELTKIYSLSHHSQPDGPLMRKRPFRSPHHTVSPVAMTGGGTWPKPGEVSLSHGGVLFLDEFPEFRRDVLESLRSPLERGVIEIARAKMHLTYPSRFMLAAAMNPCPCGYLSDPKRNCRCTNTQIQKYQSKISGPILDRIDLHVEVAALPFEKLQQEEVTESSSVIQQRILGCREIQRKRFEASTHFLNALMRPRELKKYCGLDTESRQLIEMAMKELHLSARAYYKIIKIARTIADLAESEAISSEHIAEAIQYRTLDRQWWG